MIKQTLFLVTISALALQFCRGDSLDLCPFAPNKLVGDVSIHKGGFFLITQHEIVRVPDSGVLSEPISCMLIQDTSDTGTGNVPVIQQGGIGYNYVEMKLTSEIGQELSYRIQVYTASSKTVYLKQ